MEELQQLLEKIRHEGVDKAKADADKILADARARAKAVTDQAEADAEKARAEARRDAEAFGRRAEATIRQAARDTVLSVEQAVTGLLTALLRKGVDAAMDDPAVVPGLAEAAVRSYLGGGGGVEVAAADRLAGALRARLASLAGKGVTVVTDESAGTGFRVRLEGGRVEHSFTGAAVAEALAARLRPRLAALVRPGGEA